MAGRNLLIVPFTGGIQVDVQCVGTADSEDLSAGEPVRRWLPQAVARGQEALRPARRDRRPRRTY